jgi:hypothetical protein
MRPNGAPKQIAPASASGVDTPNYDRACPGLGAESAASYGASELSGDRKGPHKVRPDRGTAAPYRAWRSIVEGRTGGPFKRLKRKQNALAVHLDFLSAQNRLLPVRR